MAFTHSVFTMSMCRITGHLVLEQDTLVQPRGVVARRVYVLGMRHIPNTWQPSLLTEEQHLLGLKVIYGDNPRILEELGLSSPTQEDIVSFAVLGTHPSGECSTDESNVPVLNAPTDNPSMLKQHHSFPWIWMSANYKDVDEATGYKTVSILCMPVKLAGRILGVVQMVNKRNRDTFSREDEIGFEALSTFFGIALHHARLYDRILRKEQKVSRRILRKEKYKVALEVLSYYNTCRESDVMTMLSDQSPFVRLALFVACLCHDLDHRGYTNKYMSEIASPLAAMYATSTLEHHHFNITVTILQQEDHNIFSHITSEECKEILGYIKHCILTTDLAMFFPNMDKLHNTDPPMFNWNNDRHRELGMAISMTAADLSASAKPWEIQIKTVLVLRPR